MLQRLTVAWSFVVFAAVAMAGEVLPLGPGTACTLASQREARTTLGVRGRHVLTCAGSTGTLVRVYVTRAGRVACTERLQVGGDGGMTPIGASCTGRLAGQTAPKAQDIDEPINLTGNWFVDAGFATCTVSVVQDGDTLSLDGICPGNGTLGGSGKISFNDHTFATEGPASGGLAARYCPGETVRMTGHVSPDGQTVDGTVACGVYELSFRSQRTN